MENLKSLLVLALGAALAGCGPTIITGSPGGDGGVPPGDAPWSSDAPPTGDTPLPIDIPPVQDVPNACTSTADCAPGMQCLGGEGCAIPWTCQPAIPRPCTADYSPFCGCDGTTFYGSSTCPDRPFLYRGSCDVMPPPPPDGGPAGCWLSNGTLCAVGDTCRVGCSLCTCDRSGMARCTPTACVDAGPPPVCRSARDCPAGTACLGPEGCGIPWTCQPALGRPCTDDLAAFCGCDGTTFYGSSTCPDRPYDHRGACGIVPPVDGGPGGCALPDGRICPFGAACRTGECTTCYCAATGELRCTGGGCVDAGPPPRTCLSNSDCAAGTQCRGEAGCGIPWTCQPAAACTRDSIPFCGCDGRIFMASSTCPGRPYAHVGPCGIVPPPVDAGVDAGPGTCVIMGVTCRVGVPCRINECTTCTCSGDTTSCGVVPGCGVDAGTPRDAGPAVDVSVPPLCPAQDARGVGFCGGFFGYAWDGSRCVGVSGCSCAGADCRGLPLDPMTCELNHRACPRPL